MRIVRFAAVSALALAIAGCNTVPQGKGDVAVSPPPSIVAPAPSMVSGYRSSNIGLAAESAADASARPQSAEAPAREYRYVMPVIVPADPGREQYDGEEVSPVKIAAAEPLSTFSVDVDTGAYANARRFLSQGQMPPKAAVRTEEFINYFRYDYQRPQDQSQPFSVSFDAARTPWNEDTRIVRIGLAGYDLDRAERPPINLVFLMDVSGSMGSADKLPLVKTALSGLAGELGPNDKVSIVVYAGAAGLVLEPTSDTRKIRQALDKLSAGGSTAGGGGHSAGLSDR